MHALLEFVLRGCVVAIRQQRIGGVILRGRLLLGPRVTSCLIIAGKSKHIEWGGATQIVVDIKIS